MRCFRRTCFAAFTTLLVVILTSLAANAQPGMTITKAVVQTVNGNQCLYTIEGTATNVGNNYTVDIQIMDAATPTPGQICTSQLVVTNGAGTWSKSFQCACGGVTANICLTDNAGLSAKPTVCAVTIVSSMSKAIPALSDLGLVALISSLVLAGSWVMWTKRTKLEAR